MTNLNTYNVHFHISEINNVKSLSGNFKEDSDRWFLSAICNSFQYVSPLQLNFTTWVD